MKKFHTFVGIGEALIDLFADGSSSLGGAPLNVAVHCHRLLRSLELGEATLVSAVGEDEHGRTIRRTLEAEAMPLAYLARSAQPTGTSSVFVEDGEAGFEIAADVAWDDLHATGATDALAARCDAVCFGSLGQRAAPSKAAIRRFLELAQGAALLYDVNLRTNSLSGTRGYSREIVESSCAFAPVVKANAHELLELGALFELPTAATGDEKALWPLMEFFLRNFPVRAVVVTRGAQGAMLLSRDERIAMPATPHGQGEVHPVGAGDAFSAGVMFGMSQGWDWHTTLELAGKMGTWVAYSPSDIPRLPGDILDFARSEGRRR